MTGAAGQSHITQDTVMKGNPLARSITFVAITLLVSSPFYISVNSAGSLSAGFGLFLTGWLWSPALAAIITCRLFRQPFASGAWRLGNPRYAVLAYLLAPGYLLVAYLPVWLLGLGHLYNTEFATRVAGSFGWQGVSPLIALACYVPLQATIGFVREATVALGEEIGWRGYLVPELAKTMSFARVSLVTGIATALWAYPMIPATTHKMSSPLWYRLSCFTIVVIGVNFAFTWLRLKSGSIWPGVILHGSHNVFLDRVFNPFTADTGRTSYFVDEFGLALAIVLVLVACIFWALRDRLGSREPVSPVA
jgi:membrane protease YdiL (CAAX protease family)